MRYGGVRLLRGRANCDGFLSMHVLVDPSFASYSFSDTGHTVHWSLGRIQCGVKIENDMQLRLYYTILHCLPYLSRG